MLDKVQSRDKLALRGVTFFLTLENNDSSSALLCTIVRTTFANLNN